MSERRVYIRPTVELLDDDVDPKDLPVGARIQRGPQWFEQYGLTIDEMVELQDIAVEGLIPEGAKVSEAKEDQIQLFIQECVWSADSCSRSADNAAAPNDVRIMRPADVRAQLNAFARLLERLSKLMLREPQDATRIAEARLAVTENHGNLPHPAKQEFRCEFMRVLQRVPGVERVFDSRDAAFIRTLAAIARGAAKAAGSARGADGKSSQEAAKVFVFHAAMWAREYSPEKKFPTINVIAKPRARKGVAPGTRRVLLMQKGKVVPSPKDPGWFARFVAKLAEKYGLDCGQYLIEQTLEKLSNQQQNC